MAKKIFSFFKNYIFWMIFIAIFCVSLDVLFNIFAVKLWSFLINKYVPSWLIYIKYLIIVILFFFNYFLLRHITISWMFEWQYPFQFFSIFKERQNYLRYLKMTLNDFTNSIDVLIDDYNSLPKIEIEIFESFFNLFEEEYNIYRKLYTIVNSNINNTNLVRYKMSKCQIKYYNLLNEINSIIINNNLKNTLTERRKKKDNSNIDDNNNFINNDISNNNSGVEKSKILIQLKNLLVRFHNIIDRYDMNNYTFMSPAYLFNLFFNDTFGSLSLYSLQFKKNLEDYILEENFTPKGKIHYTLIRKKNIINEINNEEQKIKNNDLISENSTNYFDDGILFIFCLPNGGIFELIPKTKIDFYMNSGFSFLCWNYNGYGFSKGSPSFKNIRTNVLELYDIIVHNPKYNFKKICVMGHSIGGVPAFHLAKNRHIDLIISDRNFCDLPRLVNNFLCGRILSFLLKCLFIGKTNNLENFGDINLNNTYKIILFSPIDTLILNDASMKSGISRYIIKKYVIYKNNENIIIKDKENILDIVFEKNEKERFINDFLQLVHLYYLNNNNNGNMDETRNNSYNYYSMDKTENFNFSLDKFLFSFFNKFSGCSCDDLNILIKMNVSVRRQKIFIDNFFNNLIIWGLQIENENELNLEFYSYKGGSTLKEASLLLNEFVTNITQIDNLQKTLLKNNSEHLKKVGKVVEKLDINFGTNNNININIIGDYKDNDNIKEKLINNNLKEITTDKDLNKENILQIENAFYDKLERIKGNIKILKTYAGHNGWLSEEEIEQYYIFLLSSRIIG